MKVRNWLQVGWKTMVAWGLFNASFAILVPVVSIWEPTVFTFGSEDQKFVGMSWTEIEATSSSMGPWMVLMMASMCAMMLGLGLLIVGISRNAYQRGEPWAWRWLVAASLVVLAYNLVFVVLYAQRGLYGMFTSSGAFPSGINVGVPFLLVWVAWLYVGLWLPRRELDHSLTTGRARARPEA